MKGPDAHSSQQNAASFSKDQIRASLGDMRDRLKKAMLGLRTRKGGGQAAGARPAAMDISLEMTQFIRCRVLSQAARTIPSQAGALPRIALSLISG
jgi:hypothetical protein